MTDPTISYPFGDIDSQSVAYASTINLEVKNQKTQVTVAQLTGAPTINVTPAADLRAGAELMLELKSDNTPRTVTLGTGFKGTTITGTSSKTKVAKFEYNGTLFVHISTNQVD